MLQQLLKERNLPELMQMKDGTPVTKENWEARREELLALLAEWEYGQMPDTFGETTFAVCAEDVSFCGKARVREVEIAVPMPDGETFSFRTKIYLPVTASAEKKKPAMVSIAFPNERYAPYEEIVDQDVILAHLLYTDVSLDENHSYDQKMDAHMFQNGIRKPTDPGKIGLWAFAASRVLDYLLMLDCVDRERIGVLGHSRLGKTALWAGANDVRFTHVFSNDSGCSGAALTRKKVGETIPAIFRVFPYWFCENHLEVTKTVEASETAPYDQHFLIAACAPRKVYIGSASEDLWADPVSEYLGAVAASPAWRIFDRSGFVCPERLPQEWDRFADGEIAYHLRPGTHFLSRHDWVRYLAFLKR